MKINANHAHHRVQKELFFLDSVVRTNLHNIWVDVYLPTAPTLTEIQNYYLHAQYRLKLEPQRKTKIS